MVVKIDQIAEGEPFDASAVSMRRPIHIPLDFADSLVFFPTLWIKQGMAEQVAACCINASRCAARRRSRQNGV
jgi:hypothetical protein